MSLIFMILGYVVDFFPKVSEAKLEFSTTNAEQIISLAIEGKENKDWKSLLL